MKDFGLDKLINLKRFKVSDNSSVFLLHEFDTRRLLNCRSRSAATTHSRSGSTASSSSRTVPFVPPLRTRTRRHSRS